MPAQDRTFYDYEAYADAIQDADLRSTFLGKKYANWKLTYLSLNNLRVQWGGVGGPGAIEGTITPGGQVMLMPLQNAHAISGNGHRFDNLSLMLMRPGGEFCLSATNYNRWLSVYVPDEFLTGSNVAVPAIAGPSCNMIRIPLHRAQRFRSAVEKLGAIVQRQPGVFDSSAAVRTTARKLAETVRELLRDELDVTRPPATMGVPRRQIVRRAMDFVEQHDNEYLLVEDLATAAGVSERTLRTAFQEYFSVGPARYLKLRTLHQARRRLKAADPLKNTVTEIATQLGVWELGRFAHDYHCLFGELPSETLRHQR